MRKKEKYLLKFEKQEIYLILYLLGFYINKVSQLNPSILTENIKKTIR